MSQNPLLLHLWEIEARHDSGETEGSALTPFFQAVREERWKDSYSEANGLFEQCPTAIEKAFILQWAVVATEIQYDLKTRAEWMARWSEIEGWAEESYCRYLRMYQEALTRFFEGSLQEAEIRFQKAYEIALGISYERGQMRCLFHLGLVQRDRSRFDSAAEFFRAALELAQERKAKSYQTRIEDQLARAGAILTPVAELTPERRKSQIEQCLMERRFMEARQLLIEGERKRRQAGLKRRRESYYAYLPFFRFSRKRNLAGSRMLSRISDPLMKIQALELKGRVFGFSPSEDRELRALREIHGVSSVMVSPAGSSGSEVCGFPLSQITDPELRLLIELLLETERTQTGALAKETICSRLWSYQYDPTVHDGRIYKLIHKTRRFFGKKDLFLNTYGGYRLNPKFLGRASLGVFPLSRRPNRLGPNPLDRRRSG